VPDVTDLRPGDPESIAGYRVLRRLGAGGQGVVFLAAAAGGDLVAIKQLRVGFGLDDTRARAQFVKEVAAARRVAPFCTAQVVDARLDGDSPYVVSEFIAGLSLQQQIERNGPIRGTALQRMAIGTATALAAIHQAGVVHRDFKPANVMLSPEGPRVIDFGIARDLSTDTTVTSRIFGTPAYMSPEQLRADVVGPPTDMFAWASVMAYAATGHAPFEAPHIMAVVYRIGAAEPDLGGVPDGLAAVLRQCLEKDPAGRPSAQQALAQLLGRPEPVRDQTDPTRVLAEATGLVRPASLVPGPAAPVISGPVPADETIPAWGSPQTERPAWGTAPDPAARASTPTPTSHPPTASHLMSASHPTSASTPTPASPPGRGSGPGHPAAAWGAPPPPRGRRRAVIPTIAVLVVILGGAAAFNGSGPLRADRTIDSDSSVVGADPELSAAIASAMADDPDDYSDPGATPGAVNALAVPKQFAGVWRGSLISTGTVSGTPVRLTLEAGSSSGRLRFSDLNCSGTVKVTSVLPRVITMAAAITQDPKKQCSERGTVYLTGPIGKKVQFTIRITEKGQPARAGTGTLTR
jgi:serine/threonine protein kinase